jgi:hypothetical protein
LSARPGTISRDFVVLSAAKDKSFASVENWACGELGACGQLSVERLRAVPGCRCGQQIRSTGRRASPAARRARRDTDQVATATDRHRSREAYGDYCRDRARLGHCANRASRAPSGWAVAPRALRSAPKRWETAAYPSEMVPADLGGCIAERLQQLRPAAGSATPGQQLLLPGRSRALRLG